jgi:hypothetical protein
VRSSVLIENGKSLQHNKAAILYLQICTHQSFVHSLHLQCVYTAGISAQCNVHKTRRKLQMVFFFVNVRFIQSYDLFYSTLYIYKYTVSGKKSFGYILISSFEKEEIKTVLHNIVFILCTFNRNAQYHSLGTSYVRHEVLNIKKKMSLLVSVSIKSQFAVSEQGKVFILQNHCCFSEDTTYDNPFQERALPTDNLMWLRSAPRLINGTVFQLYKCLFYVEMEKYNNVVRQNRIEYTIFSLSIYYTLNNLANETLETM